MTGGANDYTRVIIDEARRRGITVEVLDPARGELALTYAGRTVRTLESLSELTSAVAFRVCDDKRFTRQVLERAGLNVPPGRVATGDEGDEKFLAEHGDVVVKPARGEQGRGVTVGVTDPAALAAACEQARRWCPDVLIERRSEGTDLRLLVIGDEVVAASVRRPATVTGDGRSTVAELVEELGRERAAATGGASRVELDDTTRAVIAEAGHRPEDVLPEGKALAVRRTANLHTGGTIHDVTDEVHPGLAGAALAVARAIGIPVAGVDLMVPDLDGPGYVVIEANEQPGLANHEPRPTAERFVDLLFPETARR